MIRLLLLLGCIDLAQAQPSPVSHPWRTGIIVLNTGDTLRGEVAVDLPQNQTYLRWLPNGEKTLAAREISYVGLNEVAPLALQTTLSEFNEASSSAFVPSLHFITAVSDGDTLLFEVIETGRRAVLLYHPPSATRLAGAWFADPNLALLRKDWTDQPAVGFYFGDLSTDRVLPFRCSLSGLLRVLPHYHRQVREFAWQYPTLTVKNAVAYYNSLEAPAYFEKKTGGKSTEVQPLGLTRP